MREHPILFSGPMVRALLAGTKTQTRRAWREQPPPGVRVAYMPGETRCPYGQPGDRLWVRETWAKWGRDDQCGEGPSITHEPIYRADNWPWDERDQWRPSIHMPRAASRITLEVTGVRVERLQDISIEDAKAEGAWPDESVVEDCADYFGIDVLEANPRRAFQMLWERINGPGSWDADPYVWAVSFRRI